MKTRKGLCIVMLLALVTAARPAEADDQSAFNSFVDQADEVIVEIQTGGASRIGGEVPFAKIWESCSVGEIRELKSFIRILPPRETIQVVDGKEHKLIESSVCGCDGDFQVTMKKYGEVIFVFAIAHADRIKCRLHDSRGDIFVDASALEPFNARLQRCERSYWESFRKQKSEPGATDNPDDAQRSREDH